MVEDEKCLAGALKRCLDNEGFAVDVALDGLEGELAPILTLTAKDSEYNEAETLDTGWTTICPSRSRSLFRLLIFGPCCAAALPAMLRRGDLSLDPASRRWVSADADIELTARGVPILEYLTCRARKIDKPFETDTIETFRASGCRLVAGCA